MRRKLVPWESWAAWNEVREALFSPSSSPVTVAAALTKISVWRARNTLPVAIEVTADLFSIQNADPCFVGFSGLQGSSITDEMLRMMYAMAIMRLVNGVVDQSKKQNSTSVALRAKAAGLPRMLVDIRHEVAHKELPSLSYLQLASKEALEWLKLQYWESQKRSLDDTHGQIQKKLNEYAVIFEQESQITSNKDCEQHLVKLNSPTVEENAHVAVYCEESQVLNDPGDKDLEKQLVKLISANVEDAILVLADDGIVDQCIKGNKLWCHVVSRLCSKVPSLLKGVISMVLKLKSKRFSDIDFVNLLLREASGKGLVNQVKILTKLSGFHSDFDRGLAMQQNVVHDIEEDHEIDVNFNFEKGDLTLLNAVKHVDMLCKGNSGDKYEAESGPWSLVHNWRPCAIGMLPSVLHSTGVLPCFGALNVGIAKQSTMCTLNKGGSFTTLPVIEREDVDVQVTEDSNPKGHNVDLDAGLVSKRMELGSRSDNDQGGVPKRLKMACDNDNDPAIFSKEMTNGSGNDDNNAYSKRAMVVRENIIPLSTDTGKGSLPPQTQSHGYLLVNGLYGQYHTEQLAAVRSAIKILQ